MAIRLCPPTLMPRRKPACRVEGTASGPRDNGAASPDHPATGSSTAVTPATAGTPRQIGRTRRARASPDKSLNGCQDDVDGADLDLPVRHGPHRLTVAPGDPRGTGEGARPVTSEAEFVQLLTPEGERVPNATYDPWVADLTDEHLRSLYRDLLLTRRVDVEATALQRQGELGLWASCLGQEAAQVGSGRAMVASDMAFPTYREHGVALTRGVDPMSLLGLFRGVSNGGWNPGERNFALYTIVIGNQCLHAVGYAMGVQMEAARSGDADHSSAVVAYFGDGATSQGDVSEAFVFAASFN